MKTHKPFIQVKSFMTGKRRNFICMVFILCSWHITQAQVIIKFNAMLQHNAVYFSWELAPQISYASLEVERSTNNITYLTCLTMNTNNGKLYAWDKQPLPWVSYYRLKVTDLNGFVSYSDSIQVVNSSITKNTGWPSDIIMINDSAYSNSGKQSYTSILSDFNGNSMQLKSYTYAEATSPELIKSFHATGKYLVQTILMNNQVVEKKLYRKAE